jgi:hypothetical protein
MMQRSMLYSGYADRVKKQSYMPRVPFKISRPRSRIMRYSSLSVVLCLLFLTHSASAQTTTSTIEGTIKDAQGSVVAGAQIVVKSPELGIERAATSDAEGIYRITALPAGIYSLSVSHSGFASRTFDNIELTLNRTLKLDIPLEVGAVQEQVDVIENAQLLNPTTASTGATITPQQIKEMPTNGRNYKQAGQRRQRQFNTGVGRAIRQQQLSHRWSAKQGHS